MDSWPPKWLTPISEEQLQRGRIEEPVSEFVEGFGRITKDSVAGRAGGPLILRDWQRTLLEHLFAWDEDGLRNRISLVGMPRKNGKSALGAVLGLYSLILGPKGAEVYWWYPLAKRYAAQSQRLRRRLLGCLIFQAVRVCAGLGKPRQTACDW